jgi:hypothetical protein
MHSSVNWNNSAALNFFRKQAFRPLSDRTICVFSPSLHKPSAMVAKDPSHTMQEGKHADAKEYCNSADIALGHQPLRPVDLEPLYCGKFSVGAISSKDG